MSGGDRDGPPDDGTDDGPRESALPVVDPADCGSGERPGNEDDGRIEGGTPPSPAVAGVLLAAGRGRRFDGGNKLLADLAGSPVVVHAARTLLAAGLPVVAVVGYQADRVSARLRSIDHGGRLAVVGNPDYEEGQATSVRRGVRAVWRSDAAVFALGDMPRVRPGTVRALLDCFRGGAGDALAAACDRRRGNPVLFGATHYPELASLSGDRGGRDVLLEGDRSALVETGDPGVRRDVDTPDDLERLD